MEAVIQAAAQGGFPEEARHLEYFIPPAQPEYETHPFPRQRQDGRLLQVPADKTAADVLNENGMRIDVKCADGICGVCKCGVIEGQIEHRDFVLSAAQRENSIILCQSRAAQPGGVLKLDL
jgi:ferredoxin